MSTTTTPTKTDTIKVPIDAPTENEIKTAIKTLKNK
jgi:hypothetical protein